MALPVTVLTGFLGAGKTTLLRRMLDEVAPERVAVILNELGPTGIDALPDGRTGVTPRLVELADGCACCLVQDDLVAALDELAARTDLDRVILETSGLADPLPVTWIVSRPELAGRVVLDGVVAVVDAAHQEVTQVEEWRQQVRTADIVVLSKTDLVDAATVERARRAVLDVNPDARLLDRAAEAPVALLLDVDRAASVAEPLPGTGRHSDFDAVPFVEVARFDPDLVEELLEDLPREVFRAKGILQLADGRWASFHAVGGRLQIDLDAAAPTHGESRLLFFGRHLRKQALLDRVALCKTP